MSSECVELIEKRPIEGYTFVALKEINQVLQGIKDRAINLDAIRIFAATKLLYSTTSSSVYFEPKQIKKGVRGARVWAAYSDLRKVVPDFENFADYHEGIKVKFSNAALRFISKVATKGEAIVLLVFFARRMAKKGYARMSYTEIHNRSGLGRQAICLSIKSLTSLSFLIPEPCCRATHWIIWNDGRKFEDGPALWRKSERKVRQKIKPTDFWLEDNSYAETKEILVNQMSYPDISKEIKPNMSEHQTSDVSKSNPACQDVKLSRPA